MTNEITTEVLLEKDQILFTAGDDKNDLYYLTNGKVLVFVQNGSQITPVAYISKNEFIGELTFFDQTKRSASIIALEPSRLVKISSNELYQTVPNWLLQIGQKLSGKIRKNDEIIRTKGMRKTNVETIRPLSIDEQTKIYKLVEEYKKSGVTKS